MRALIISIAIVAVILASVGFLASWWWLVLVGGAAVVFATVTRALAPRPPAADDEPSRHCGDGAAFR